MFSVPGVTSAASALLLPWKWLLAYFYPPHEFPLPSWPLLGHLPYIALVLLVTLRFDRAVTWMSKISGYGAFKANIGRFRGVFLNDVDSIKAAIEDSDCCNSRPYTTFGEMFFHESITMSSGKKWRKLKQLALRGLEDFGPSRPEFNDALDDDVKKMLRIVTPIRHPDTSEAGSTLLHPADFRHFFYAVSVNASIWILMRKRMDLESKQFETLVTTVVETLGKGGSVAAYDLFPPLLMKLLPDMITGMSAGKKKRDIIHGFLYPMIDAEMKGRIPGKPRHLLDSMFDELLDPSVKIFDEPTVRREILPSVADLVCSPESTGSSLGWCLAYLAANPYDQKKVQDEIDALNLAHDELPAYGEHKSRMPYTLACLFEAVRLGSAAAMGFPHINPESDCKVKGLTIEKGSYVLPNLYAAHRDPKYFPKPEEFMPSRFLESTGKGDRFKPSEGFLAFSAGQRRCPAENVAWHVIFKTMCAILKTFDLTAERPRRVPAPAVWLPFVRAPSSMTVLVRARAHGLATDS